MSSFLLFYLFYSGYSRSIHLKKVVKKRHLLFYSQTYRYIIDKMVLLAQRWKRLLLFVLVITSVSIILVLLKMHLCVCVYHKGSYSGFDAMKKTFGGIEFVSHLIPFHNVHNKCSDFSLAFPPLLLARSRWKIKLLEQENCNVSWLFLLSSLSFICLLFLKKCDIRSKSWCLLSTLNLFFPGNGPF